VVFIPALLLAVTETILILAGVGHPTSFLLRREIHGRKMLVDNPWFGLRFFPPALARSPTGLTFLADKQPGVFRIFLFGESAALGDPRPAYGMGRFLEALLNDRFPGTKFEVICVAMTAINSHAILPMARECARYHGDLWIVYMGNNEFAGPFGANTVFGPQAPPAWTVRLFLAIQRTRTGQVLASVIRRFHSGQATPASWAGMKMFLEHQLPPHDLRRERVYANFSRNLEDILSCALKNKIPVVLSSVASNLKDCPPFASEPSTRMAEWRQCLDLALTNVSAGNFTQAAAEFDKALESNPDSAETHFRLGACLLAETNITSARGHFESARDLDTLPFRTDSHLNQIIERAAKQHGDQRVVFVNSDASLASLSQSGIPGWEAFFEHVHLNWDGNYRIAIGLAEAAVQCLPPAVTAHQQPAWAGQEICEQRLGLTDWNRYTILEEMLRRLSEPPFTDQINHVAQMEGMTNAMAELRTRARADSAEAARRMFETQLTRFPEDHYLHHNFAEFLTAVGDFDAATRQMETVCELLPDNQAVYFQLGRLLARQKKYREAQDRLETAVKLRPELANSRVELGQVLAAQGSYDKALEQYDLAMRCSGADEARLHLLSADVYARQNRHDAAIDQLRQTVQIRDSYWEAHELLGMELARQTNFAAAQQQFERVVDLRPAYAEGHLNLGIALARQRRFPEAAAQFQATLRLDPKNAQAQEFLSTLKGFLGQPGTQ